MDNQVITRVLLIGLSIAVVAVLVIQYQQSAHKTEKFGTPSTVSKSGTHGMKAMPSLHGMKAMPAMPKEPFAQNVLPMGSQPAIFGSVQQEMLGSVMPSEPVSNESYRAVDFTTENKLPKDSCFPRDKTTAEELLPNDAANSMWAQVAPAGQGDVSNQNYLTAGYMVGIDTIGQTLRNANYQIRSDPPNPRFAVGPWMQSTIEFDNSHKFFEIGSQGC